MNDLIVAFGLMLIIEGGMYALFPNHLKKMIIEVLQQDSDKIRIFGMIILLVGFFIVWTIRHH